MNKGDYFYKGLAIVSKERNMIYIGLSYNLAKRYTQHMTSKNPRVREIIDGDHEFINITDGAYPLNSGNPTFRY